MLKNSQLRQIHADMARADDSTGKNYFQSDRFFQVNEQWFFYVRESSSEQGPFPSKASAQSELHAYLKTRIGVSTNAWDIPGANR